MPQFEHDGCTLYYEVHGKTGPALVFAHGRGGCTASWWQQVPAFRDDHRVVLIDHRGFARSACPDGRHLDRFVPDMVALLDHLEIDRAVLVGQSMGGRTALGMAVHHPDRVRGIVLSCTAGGLLIPAVEATQEARQTIPRGIEAPTAALAPAFREGQPAMTVLYEALRAMTTMQGPLFRESLAALDGGVTPADLAGYAVPTLVLSGEFDPLYPHDVLVAVAEAIPGATLTHMPGAGHSPYWEMPERFNALVRGFVAGLPA